MGKKLLTFFIASVMMLSTMFATVSAKELPVPNELGTTSDDVYSSDLMLGNCSGAVEVSGSAATPVDKAVSKLEKVANYWGWQLKRVGKTKILPNKVLVATVNLTNSKYEFKGVECRVTSKRTTYAFGGYKYTLKSWKSVLKQYSVKEDLKKVTINKAKSAAKSLETYGKQHNWYPRRTRSYKSGNAYENIDFANSLYQFKVQVVATRKSGKISLTYKVGGVKTTKSWIETCLKKYATSAVLESANCYGSAGLVELTPGPDGSVIESAPEASSEESFGSSEELLNSGSNIPETTGIVEESLDLVDFSNTTGDGELLELELSD